MIADRRVQVRDGDLAKASDDARPSANQQVEQSRLHIPQPRRQSCTRRLECLQAVDKQAISRRVERIPHPLANDGVQRGMVIRKQDAQVL